MEASPAVTSDRGFPNPLVLYENHFNGHGRSYPLRTRLAVATDLGFDGFELARIEPADDRSWDDLAAAIGESGIGSCGMYWLAWGVADDQARWIEAEVDRACRIADRLASLPVPAFLNLTIASSPSGNSTSNRYDEIGSATAEERHWERAATLVREIDGHVATRGIATNLYNHVRFMTDTPAACLRILEASGARVIKPGFASFHAYVHQDVGAIDDALRLPGMQSLGYVALLNTLGDFATTFTDTGKIDMAGLLAVLWRQGYAGPIVSQAYDVGGDPYLSAERSMAYLRSVWDRFQRNPQLDPTSPAAAPDRKDAP